MFQKSLQLAPAIIVARLDERGKEAGTLHSEYSKASNKACFRKQGATLANFIPCYQKIFAPKKFLIKIHADFCRWQGTFCLVFAFSFTSCYNSNALPQFGVLQYKFDCSIVTETSKWE